VLRKAEGRGLGWPLPEELDDKELYRILFLQEISKHAKAEPDFELINKELLKKGVTLMLCWQEYCEKTIQAGREPYQYSAFCHRYRAWARQNHIVMHIERRPGQSMMVDWAGTSMQTLCRDSGEVQKVSIFVACLPYSSYLYVQGFHSMKQESWLSAHINALEYFGGVTPIVIPDNLRTGIAKHTLDELIVNSSYRRLAEYYGFAVVPARPRKPRDKAAVEAGVGAVTRSVIAPLRNHTFFSLEELNESITTKVEELATRPFQKREGSRRSIFETIEKDTLLPLPKTRYEVYVTKTATVPYNYHVSVDSLFYSVPFAYVRREVELRVSKKTVSVYFEGKRVAMHKRSFGRRGTYVTDINHMPDTHKDFAEWTGERFRKWAGTKGAGVAEVVDAILSAKPIEQQAYRSCRAVIALGERYGDKTLDEACTRALAISHSPSYKTVKTLIASMGDAKVSAVSDVNAHAYLRGADYFEDPVFGGESCG
jgi:transposase